MTEARHRVSRHLLIALANELEAVVITILVPGIEGWYNGHRLRSHSFHFHARASVGASRRPHQDGGLQVKIPAGQV